jgi:heat shock protein HslJ
MIRTFRSAALVAAACFAAGCSATASAPGGTDPTGGAKGAAATRPAPTAPTGLDGTAWTLASLAGRPIAAGGDATLRFEGDRVSGSDGCNRFAGPWTGAGATVRIGPQLAATRRACPEPQGALAAEFNRMLVAARAWRIDGATLVLLGEGGAPLASFEPQATGLAGTAWQVVAYNTGHGAVTSVATGAGAGARPTIEFDAAGGVRGSAGCNTYSGTWTETAGRLSLGPLRTTRMACPSPADAMQREAAFLAALQSAATSRREGDRLELRTASGALAVSAVAAPAR